MWNLFRFYAHCLMVMFAKSGEGGLCVWVSSNKEDSAGSIAPAAKRFVCFVSPRRRVKGGGEGRE